MGVQLGLVQKSGSWFSMGEMRIGQGRDAARQYLKDNPDIAEKLEEDIREGMAKQAAAAQAKPEPRASIAPPAAASPRAAAAAVNPRAVDVSAEDFEDE